MTKTVLITTDGSARSHRIIPHAAALAEACNARILLCRVLDPKNDLVVEPGEARENAEARAMQRLEGELKATIERMGIEGQALVTRPEDGQDVPSSILRAAGEAEADIIAIESHGGGAIRSAILGSVAMGIVGKSDLPVMVGGPNVEPVPPAGPYTIVATTDGSPASEAAFRAIAPLIDGAAIQVKVLQVYSVDVGSTPEQMAVKLQPRLDQMRALLPASAAVQTQLKQIAPGGGIDSAIIEQALADHADAIALCRHGQTARRTILIGSTAQLVLERSRVPVILARAP